MGHQLGLDQLPCGRCGLMMQGPQAFPDMWLYHRSQSFGPPGHIYRKIRPTQRQRNQQPQTRGRKDTVKRSNCGAGHCSNDVCLFQPTLLCHFQRLGVWRCGTQPFPPRHTLADSPKLCCSNTPTRSFPRQSWHGGVVLGAWKRILSQSRGAP